MYFGEILDETAPINLRTFIIQRQNNIPSYGYVIDGKFFF